MSLGPSSVSSGRKSSTSSNDVIEVTTYRPTVQSTVSESPQKSVSLGASKS